MPNEHARVPNFVELPDAVYHLGKVDERADVWVGGDGSGFQAKVRSEKWNNPDPRYPGCWLEMSAQGVEESQANKRQIKRGRRHGRDGDILTSEFGRKKKHGTGHTTEHHEWYIGNSLDWDVRFTSKDQLPDERAENGDYILRFDLSYPHGLSFYDQGYLTQAEKDEGTEREAKFENSICAFFNKSGRFMSSEGGELVNYETGKYGVIQRPDIILHQGTLNEEHHWGYQIVVGTELLVYIPQAVVNAWNPSTGDLVVDPTFGYTSIGGTSVTVSVAYCARTSPNIYTAGSSEQITAFTMYGKSAVGNTQEAAAYTISSGQAVNQLASPVSVSLTSTAAWRTASGLTQSLTSGVTYGCATGSSDSSSLVAYYDSTGSSSDTSQNNSRFSDPWVHNISRNRYFSVYATYGVVATANVPAAVHHYKMAGGL